MEARKRPRHRLVLGALVLLALGSQATAAEDAVVFRPPAGWLAVLELPSLTGGEALLAEVLDDLGYELAAPVTAVLQRLGLEQQHIGERPLMVGLAEGPGGAAYPFVLLTPPDPEELIFALGGERTGDSAVVEIAGFSLAFSPFGEGLLAAPLAFEPVVEPPGADSLPLPELGEELRLALSPAGIDYLERRANSFDNAKRSAARKLLRSPWRWPPRLAKVDAVLGMNTPLWAEATKHWLGGWVSAARNADGACVLQISLHRKTATRAANNDGPVTATQPFDDEAITILNAAELPTYLPALTRLFTAYYQGRPDSIEAAKFADQQYADYATKLETAAELMSAAHTTLRVPEEGAPVFANRMALLTTPDADRLIAALVEVSKAWNSLVDASAAKTRLTFSKRPLARAGLTGVVLAADMILAAGVDDTRAMRDLMDKFVGESGWMTVRIVRLDDTHVLVSDMPWDATASAAAKLRKSRDGSTRPEASGVAGLSWHVDRFVAWQCSVRELELAGTLGARPTKSMRIAPPMSASMRIDGPAIEARATLRRETVQAIGDYLRAN